jgi:ribonuclease G
MQSAFVDIGLGRDAFLYVSDFFEDNDEYDKIVTSVEEKVLKLDRTPAPVVQAPPVEATAAEAVSAPAADAVAVPVDVPPAAPLSPPASAMQVPAGFQGNRRPDGRHDGRQDRSGDRGPDQGGDRRGDQGGDRRGRRSRRGRGQRGGGRGLPEAKYYSPRPEGESRHQAPPVVSIPEAAPVEEAPPQPRVIFDPEQDDFFVLPGESLAKYTRPGEEEAVEGTESEPLREERGRALEEFESEGAPASLAEAVVEAEAARGVSETVAALEPVVVPEAVAAPEATPVTEEPPAAQAEAMPIQVFSLETGFSAAETEVPETAATPDVEAVADDTVEIDEEEPEIEGEPEGTEASAEGEGTEEGTGEAVVEDEGPEPARIPTSLTATLREQGGRYPHRVSRRTRRKGRGGDRGPAPEGQRGPQGEARPLEQGGEQRTIQRPEGRPDGRPEGRPDSRPEARGEARPDARPEARTERIPLPSISDLLKEGQEIIVQIAKEPLGQKGARITSHIALPGRFLVYMPTVDHIGVSRKIPSDEERLRLKRILQANRTGISGGYIVRTAGEGRTEDELRADMMFLYNLWLDMRQKAERRPAPVLIHHDLNVVERILRDQLTAAYKSVWVDNEEAYESVLRFVQRFQPALVNRVKMYTRAAPIFDEFGITAELEKALRPKVWLKSGGYIVINQTEALVAIDINTGKYVGKSNRLEDTIVKTNTDAIKEIVRQIRLRDLGGIIVVDFIDMDERKNRQKVMQALEENMRADRAPYKILQFNDFGLVAITRKRVKQSLERTLCTPCSYCEGAGYVKSPQTVVSEILVEAQKIARAVDTKDVMLRVAPEVAKLLKSNQNTYLQEIEEILSKPVIVKSDPLLHQEKFDLA